MPNTTEAQQDEEQRERERDYTFGGPICFHCTQEIDAACEAVIDCIGETFCSTFCATMVARYEHGEGCAARFAAPCPNPRHDLPTLPVRS